MSPPRALSIVPFAALLALSASCGPATDSVDDVDRAGHRSAAAPDGGACIRCETALVDGIFAAPRCAPDRHVYDALESCVCAGDCAPRCDGLCGGDPITAPCVACVVERCQAEYAACLDDR